MKNDGLIKKYSAGNLEIEKGNGILYGEFDEFLK